MKYNALYNDIERVLEHIEKTIRTAITLDEIAIHANISKFYLNRVFHSISSTSLMNYVKRRKLTESTVELLNTDLRISDISQDYGFEYVQSYIRSFKNLFGLSPDQFRKERPILKITDRINLDYIRAIGNDGITSVPQIVIIPEFFIVGIKYKIYLRDDKLLHEANLKGNDFYYNWGPKIKNTISSKIYIGLVDTILGDKSYNFYTPSFQVPKPDTIPAGMISRKIPTNKYAIFKYIGLHPADKTNVNNLISIMDYIYEEWLPKSGYWQSAPYHFERINEKLSRSNYCEVEICIPVSNHTDSSSHSSI